MEQYIDHAGRGPLSSFRLVTAQGGSEEDIIFQWVCLRCAESQAETALRSENPEQPSENDTLIFDLRVRCDRNREAARGETDPQKLYYDSNVYSGRPCRPCIGDTP